MLLDNVIAGGQANACTFSRRLGGEKRVKKPFYVLFGYTIAVVPDRNHEPRCFNLNIDVEAALAFNRINGIADNVEQHLFDFRGIASDFWNICRHIHLNGHTGFLFEAEMKQFDHICDHILEIHLGKINSLSRAEGKQIFYDVPASVALGNDDINIFVKICCQLL